MSPLKEKILQIIRAAGPISLSDYMMLALYDAEHGYYMTRDPLGAPKKKGGDFVTAPEISQMFGELIGAFFVKAWEDGGRPARFHLAEFGPGRGTLMADLLRAARVRPEFLKAANVTLVETSPVLRAAQAKALEGTVVKWADAITDISADAPLFLIANEFFDALPVRQFVKAKGWHERVVGADGGSLVYGLAPDPTALSYVPEAPDGAVYEISPAARAVATMIAERIARRDGVALIVDYGHAEPGFGDTFQAVKAHTRADPLAEPGEADLTTHVDFAALANAAVVAGCRVFGPVAQGQFLAALGIKQRAERMKLASPELATEIEAAIGRLTGPDQMGTLFKAMAICEGSAKDAAGF